MQFDFEPAWKHYLPGDIIDNLWNEDRLSVYAELKSIYMMEHPPEHYARGYWERQITRGWYSGYDWQYLWDRTGRPVSHNLDVQTIRECARVHLYDCLIHTHPFCDLKSKRSNFCINCYEEIIACESNDYCARCHRQQTKEWKRI